jgi:8-oxo-dGTP pyrophosphatase MutT (NUDIX family)
MTTTKARLFTLLFVLKDDRVLLGMKKRGFGSNRWNGFGGKVENGETIEQAAIRELEEECSLRAASVEHRGVLTFEFVEADAKYPLMHVFVYRCSDFDGEPSESDEMRPQWFDRADIPYGKMWQDDEHWLPKLLDGDLIRAKFVFDGVDTMVSGDTQVVSSVDQLTPI